MNAPVLSKTDVPTLPNMAQGFAHSFFSLSHSNVFLVPGKRTKRESESRWGVRAHVG